MKYINFFEDINWEFDDEEYFEKKDINWIELKKGDLLVSKKDFYMYSSKEKFLIKDKGYIVNNIDNISFYLKSEIDDEHGFQKTTNSDVYFYH